MTVWISFISYDSSNFCNVTGEEHGIAPTLSTHPPQNQRACFVIPAVKPKGMHRDKYKTVHTQRKKGMFLINMLKIDVHLCWQDLMLTLEFYLFIVNSKRPQDLTCGICKQKADPNTCDVCKKVVHVTNCSILHNFDNLATLRMCLNCRGLSI